MNPVFIPSVTDPATVYRCEKTASGWTCSCAGWPFRAHCAHIREASAIMASGCAGSSLSADASAVLRNQAKRLERLADKINGAGLDLDGANKIWDKIAVLESALNSASATLQRNKRSEAPTDALK